MRKGRILISVQDKQGLEKFRKLTDWRGREWEIVSTGGTAARLKELGIPVTPVEQVTGFPEMLDGRVKTLHPKIMAGILAVQSNQSHLEAIARHGIELFDAVVCNLYGFLEKPSIENIDIGGPSIIRAAAKNGSSIAPVVDPNDYDRVIDELLRENGLDDGFRLDLAIKAFNMTALFDTAVAHWLLEQRTAGAPIFSQPAATAH